MKIFLILMTAFLVQVSASTFAQKITLNEKRASLISIFEKINKQSGVDFLLNIKLLNDAKPVSINANNEELAIVLEKIFDGQPLDYEIKDKAVLVSKKTPSILERIANRWASIDIFGRVVDAENRPLAGATVKIKSTGKSVLTDANGKFTVARIEEGTVLVVSYTGYVSKEVSSSLNMGNIILEPSLSKLDEVQVIAYGTTTQRLSTGNVTTVKAADIEKQPVNNPLLALQGRVPGLYVEQTSGFVGSEVKVRIQGTNSMNNGNDPLYVIDGVPYGLQGSALQFISSADIASIDILKDADATSIYGTRAANGAILITTKKGLPGDAKINLSMQTGLGKVTRKINLMDRDQYLEMRREGFRNDGIDLDTPPYSSNQYKIDVYPDLSGWWDNKRSTDWQKELLGKTARYTDVNGSVSGGNNSTLYLIGGNYHKETAVTPGNYADMKGSMHFNISSSSLNNKFKFELIGSYLTDNNTLPGVDLTQDAVSMSPVAPSLYIDNGNLNWVPDLSGVSSFSNPLAYLENKSNRKTNNLVASGILSYQILKGLELKSNFGYNSIRFNNVNPKPNSRPEEQQYVSDWVTSFEDISNGSWSIEPLLRYQGQIYKGRLEVLLGSTLQQNKYQVSNIDARGFSIQQVMEDIKAATVLTPTSSVNEVYKYNALFGRLNYNFRDIYILNITARRDGSSRFGSENKFHDFWSIGGAWIFSEEKLISKNISFLSFGKLRGSYGTTGSDQIGEYKFLSLYNTSVPYGIPYQGVIGYTPAGLSNPYLQWEETKKLQLGLDIGLLKDRFIMSANYSLNRSSNQLLIQGLPIQTGFYSYPTNFGATVQNRGWEFSVSISNIANNNFKWTTNINLTLPKNKLVKFPNYDNSIYSSGLTYVIGKSINLKRLYHFLGVDPLTGIYQIADRNGNPTKSPNSIYSTNSDAVILLDTDPKFYGGILNTFSYKNLQLDVLLYFSKQLGQNYLFGGFIPGGYWTNQSPESLMERWTKPGDITSIQKYTATNFFELYMPLQQVQMYSDAGWSDVCYLRLKNIALSWQLPETWTKSMHLNNCRLYMQGQNLLTLTNYTGLDPETKSSTSLPPLRVLTFGIQIGL